MPSALEVADLESLRSILRSFRSLLTHEPAKMQAEIVAKLRLLFKAESGALLFQPGDRKGYVRLVASEPKTPTDTLDFQITNEPGRGLTGFFAVQSDVCALNSQELGRHPSRTNAVAGHLTAGKCYSILAIPMRDERGFLLAMLKFENKLGPGGVAGPEDFFSEKDEMMARLISESVAALIESSIRRSILLDLARRTELSFSGHDALQNVLNACLSLLNADRADLAFWNEAKGELVTLAQVGPPPHQLEVERLVPRNSIVYEQWSYDNTFFVVPEERLSAAGFLPSNQTIGSELVFLCRTGGVAKAVLNVESCAKGWFSEDNRPLLELLGPIIIQAVGKFGVVGTSKWPPSPPGIGWFSVIRRQDRPLTQRQNPFGQLFISVSPSCAEMFGLPPTATIDNYKLLTDTKAWGMIQSAVVKAVLENDKGIEKLSKMEFKIYPALGRPKVLKFFGILSDAGEVQCTLLDITDPFTLSGTGTDENREDRWKKDLLSGLRISFSNTDGKYLHITDATAKMYGYATVDEFYKDINNASQLYQDSALGTDSEHKHYSERRKTLLREIEKCGYVDGFEFPAWKFDAASGKRVKIWVSQDVRLHQVGKDKTDSQLFACFTDISDRKAMERKLSMSGVAGALLHDAKGPFMQIANNAATIAIYIKNGNSDQCKSLLAEIQKACEDGYKETQRWLDIAKGKVGPGFESLLVIEDLKRWIRRAQADDLKLEIILTEELPSNCALTYNTQMLGFAFLQLFKNVKAQDDGRKICKVTAEYKDPLIVFTVDDGGPGFGGDLGTGWKAIAELDKRLSKRGENGGIGLVMCNAVVEIHHGEMRLSDWVLPDDAKGGARITLTFHSNQTLAPRTNTGL